MLFKYNVIGVKYIYWIVKSNILCNIDFLGGDQRIITKRTKQRLKTQIQLHFNLLVTTLFQKILIILNIMHH